MANGLFVAYYRCSTAEQGRSGLGIEAQKKTVAQYLNGGDWQLIGEYEEHESGRNNDRPRLKNALDHCKRTGATLVIARLDRLSRSASFITALMDSKVNFVCCDMPEANEFTITIMAALAQVEAKRISHNTKAALERAKARGVKLGCAKGSCNVPAVDRTKGGKASGIARTAAAAERHALVVNRVRELKEEGLSLRGIATKLTEEHIEPPRKGGSWNATAIKRMLDRA